MRAHVHRTTTKASIAALVLAHACAHAAGPHEHGAATLHIAVEGDRLQLELRSPLENLVGFERAPRNDRERAAVKRMAERLREPERLFVPTAEARCTRASVELESAVLDSVLLGGQTRAAPAQAAGGGHASLDATIAFRCDSPRELKGIEVKAFEAFPGLKRIDVQVAGTRKQAGAKLTPRSPRVTW